MEIIDSRACFKGKNDENCKFSVRFFSAPKVIFSRKNKSAREKESALISNIVSDPKFSPAALFTNFAFEKTTASAKRYGLL